MEEEDAELEWERELAENIKKVCATSSGAAVREIIVDGTNVRKKCGLVLISGSSYNFIGPTEIYDYTNNSVREGPNMAMARYRHASVTLANGNVALFGGCNYGRYRPELSCCEVFDVKSNSFSEIGNMYSHRDGASAVLLKTGLVFIAGGHDGDNLSGWLDCCEFYNPTDRKFHLSKAKMSVGRFAHTASLLPDGRVLICGGGNLSHIFQTTEIYDPLTDSFSAGPSMILNRFGHTATTLLDGRILITGGLHCTSSTLTELYDPATNSFTAGPKTVVIRRNHFSALLPDGSVLIGGGGSPESRITTEIYDPATNTFTTSCNLLKIRECASASNF